MSFTAYVDGVFVLNDEKDTERLIEKIKTFFEDYYIYDGPLPNVVNMYSCGAVYYCDDDFCNLIKDIEKDFAIEEASIYFESFEENHPKWRFFRDPKSKKWYEQEGTVTYDEGFEIYVIEEET